MKTYGKVLVAILFTKTRWATVYNATVRALAMRSAYPPLPMAVDDIAFGNGEVVTMATAPPRVGQRYMSLEGPLGDREAVQGRNHEPCLR